MHLPRIRYSKYDDEYTNYIFHPNNKIFIPFKYIDIFKSSPAIDIQKKSLAVVKAFSKLNLDFDFQCPPPHARC